MTAILAAAVETFAQVFRHRKTHKGFLLAVAIYVILQSWLSTMARHRVVSVKGSQKKGNKQAAKNELPSDDEIDKFHKSKDKLSLNPSEDEVSDDEEGASEEEAVYNLSESEEDSEEEDDEDDDDDDDEETDTGRLAERTRPQIIAQSSILSFRDSGCTRLA